MTRIKVKNLVSGAVLDMDVEPDGTAQEILKSAAAYWGEPPTAFVLRRAGKVLGRSTTIVEASIEEDEVLEFLSEAEARRTVLLLVSAGGQSVRVEADTVLGRDVLGPFVEKTQEADRISGRHVSVWHREGIFAVEDGAGGHPSRNGTTLNGQSIRGRGLVPVRDGDVLGMARVLHLTVRIVQGE